MANEDKNNFNPKDGDFLHNKYHNITVIYKETYLKRGGIVTYAGVFDNAIDFETGRGWGYTSDFRYATEQEKQALLERLKKYGKTWNAEKKCIENIDKPEKENSDEFERLSKPLIEFIKKNYHPHCTIIINSEGAELLEGKIGYGFKE